MSRGSIVIIAGEKETAFPDCSNQLSKFMQRFDDTKDYNLQVIINYLPEICHPMGTWALWITVGRLIVEHLQFSQQSVTKYFVIPLTRDGSSWPMAC